MPAVRHNTVKAYLAKVGLDDWKRQLPLGIFLAIPVIQNEWLILSEETQLVGCFCLFCGTAYQLGADSFAKMLDDKAEAIIAEHNAVEEKAIDVVKSTVAAHEQRIANLEALKGLADLEASTTAELEVLKAQEYKHQTYDKYVLMLENLAAKEEQTKAAITEAAVAAAAKAVAANFTDKEVKDKSLNEAIAILQKGGTSTLVPGLFADYFKARTKQAQDAVGKEVKLSAAAIADIEAEISAMIKRDGLEPAEKITVSPTVVVV